MTPEQMHRDVVCPGAPVKDYLTTIDLVPESDLNPFPILWTAVSLTPVFEQISVNESSSPAKKKQRV
jgi:hypothetical protein